MAGDSHTTYGWVQGLSFGSRLRMENWIWIRGDSSSYVEGIHRIIWRGFLQECSEMRLNKQSNFTWLSFQVCWWTRENTSSVPVVCRRALSCKTIANNSDVHVFIASSAHAICFGGKFYGPGSRSILSLVRHIRGNIIVHFCRSAKSMYGYCRG